MVSIDPLSELMMSIHKSRVLSSSCTTVGRSHPHHSNTFQRHTSNIKQPHSIYYHPTWQMRLSVLWRQLTKQITKISEWQTHSRQVQIREWVSLENAPCDLIATVTWDKNIFELHPREISTGICNKNPKVCKFKSLFTLAVLDNQSIF